MLILTPENETRDLDELPNDLKEDIRFCVLEVGEKEYDFYFRPLIMLETFNAPAVVLRIGKFSIPVPCLKPPNDWKLLIGDAEVGDLELSTIEDLNNRDFNAFVYNPLSSFTPKFLNVSLEDNYTDIEWAFPRLDNNNLLCVPLTKGLKPECIYFINGNTSKKLDIISIQKVLE